MIQARTIIPLALKAEAMYTSDYRATYTHAIIPLLTFM